MWRPIGTLRPFSINVRFARAGEAFIVFDDRHARVSKFSKPATARAGKATAMEPALKQTRPHARRRLEYDVRGGPRTGTKTPFSEGNTNFKQHCNTTTLRIFDNNKKLMCVGKFSAWKERVSLQLKKDEKINCVTYFKNYVRRRLEMEQCIS